MRGEDVALDRGAHRHDLVGIHALVWLLLEEIGDALLHERHSGLPADQYDLIDVGRSQSRIRHALLHRVHRLVHDVADEFLERLSRHLHVEVARARLVVRDERQVDLGHAQGGQIALRLLTGVLEALQGHQIIAQVRTPA